MSPRPYASAARAYLRAGYSPLPLPPRKKASPPEGYTGRNGREVSAGDVDRWLAEHRSGNIGLRLPPGVIAIDVDAYKGADHVAAWEELIARYGPLPDGPWCPAESRPRHAAITSGAEPSPSCTAPDRCWSAPVIELKPGRKLRRARSIPPAAVGRPRTLSLVRVAEDKRFELLRGCPQHAFQVC